MAIIKRPDKKGGIRYQVRLKGHEAKTFGTRKEARDYEATLRLRRRQKTSMTCADLVARYGALWEEGQLPRQSAKPKRSTLSTRRQNLALFIAEFGAVDVDDLDALHVESWATTNRWAVTSVSPIFNYAVKRDIVAHNPFAQYMPKPGEGRRHIPLLDDEEVVRLAECAQSVWPYGRSFVLWQAYTGMRPSESYALDRPLEIANDVLRIERGVYEGVIDTPKTGSREILLLPQAKEALRSVPGISGPLFQSVWGRRLSNNIMSRIYWKKTRQAFAPCRVCGAESGGCPACDRHGYAKSAPDIYDLRHFCAHLLYVRMDLPSRDVAAQLGNSPYLIENLYGHWKAGATDRLRTAIAERGVPVTSGAQEAIKPSHLQAVSE